MSAEDTGGIPGLPEVLSESLKLRCPVFREDTPPRSRVSQLESYLLLIAFTQGNLAAERVARQAELRPLKAQWARVRGWEIHRRSKTETAVEDAKRQVNPKLAESIEDLEFVIAELNREVARLEADSVKVSRAYSIITGT